MITIKSTKSIATDKQGNIIDAELTDSNKKANPNGHLETIQNAVNEILKDNKDIRKIEDRDIVKLLVERKLNIKIKSGETVARCCRHCQNTLRLFNPEKPDNRESLEETNREFYSK